MAWDEDYEEDQRKRTIALDAPRSSAPRLLISSPRRPVTPSPRHPVTPSGHSSANSRDSLLDWLERLLVLGLYGWLVFRIVNSYLAEGGFVNLLLLPSEGLVVFFMLIRRRASTISIQPGDWIVAILATCIGFLVFPVSGRALVSVQLAATVLLAGILVQVLAKIALGRSLGCVPAHRGLKLSGPYRFIRHPMYAGYLLSQLAFLAVNPSLWNAGMYTLEFALQLYRLGAEERLLSRDPRYSDYRRTVRYRLVPGLF
jgi:protein-S-isoprenylcysteine O-methyltransferase Ste14